MNRLGPAAITISFLMSPMAVAEPTQSDVLGTWGFQTNPYYSGACYMTGTMHVAPLSDDGVYPCELTATETCDNDDPASARQTCKIRQNGRQLTIISNVEEILLPVDQNIEYLPDNFTLTVQSEDRMYGALVSFITVPVEFRRAQDGVS